LTTTVPAIDRAVTIQLDMDVGALMLSGIASLFLGYRPTVTVPYYCICEVI
jgi:hypothetical protein